MIWLIIGDAAANTVVKFNPEGELIHGNLKVDGSRWNALMVSAGGMKIRPEPEMHMPTADPNGNTRSLDNLVMKGDAIFNFVMQKVPPMVESLMQDSDLEISQIDNFLFHQPNPFMLKKLANKLYTHF